MECLLVKKMLKIDWSKILTNAISLLVSTIVLGAAFYVWKGVESVDSRIEKNFGTMEKTQNQLKATQEVLSPKVDNNKKEIEQLKEIVNEISNFHIEIGTGIEPRILLENKKEAPSIQMIQQRIKETDTRD